jgi:signal transduction histidine kinase
MPKFFGAPKKPTPNRDDSHVDESHVSAPRGADPANVVPLPLLAETVITRQRGQTEKQLLSKLMDGAVSVQRTYLATGEAMPIHRLIQKVALPVDEVLASVRELIACGLLMIVETPASAKDGAAGGNLNKLPAELAFAEDLRGKAGSFEQQWIKALATPSEVLYDESFVLQEANLPRMHAATMELMKSLFKVVMDYGELFNRSAVDKELHIICTNLGEIRDRLPKPDGRGTVETKVIRWRASTAMWSLSVRARSGLIEFFLVSTAAAMSLGIAEHELQSLGKLELAKRGDDLIWLAEGMPVSLDDVRGLLRSCMRELIRSSINELLNKNTWAAPGKAIAESVAQLHARQSVMEKQNLAQKIVSQQEEIQRRIARDLHDAVIADVTLLTRSISSEPAINTEIVVASLEQIAGRLREICYDLSPSDLKDWGLQTTLEALLEQVAKRCGAECVLNCEMEIPGLESSVELHVFRIVQESLNNCAKYSGASQISTTVQVSRGWLQFIVADNGCGFDAEEQPSGRTKDGGMGMTSMQERIELIRTLYPVRLEVESQPGQGTKTTLSIKINQ